MRRTAMTAVAVAAILAGVLVLVSQGDEPLEVTDSSAIFSEFSVVSSSAMEPVIRVLHVDSTGDNRSLTVPAGRSVEVAL